MVAGGLQAKVQACTASSTGWHAEADVQRLSACAVQGSAECIDVLMRIGGRSHQHENGIDCKRHVWVSGGQPGSSCLPGGPGPGRQRVGSQVQDVVEHVPGQAGQAPGSS